MINSNGLLVLVVSNRQKLMFSSFSNSELSQIENHISYFKIKYIKSLKNIYEKFKKYLWFLIFDNSEFENDENINFWRFDATKTRSPLEFIILNPIKKKFLDKIYPQLWIFSLKRNSDSFWSNYGSDCVLGAENSRDGIKLNVLSTGQKSLTKFQNFGFFRNNFGYPPLSQCPGVPDYWNGKYTWYI